MSAVIIRNLSDVLAAFNLTEDRLEKAVEEAVKVAGLAIQRQAMKNADTGVHKRGEPRIPGTGPGPNRVSGNLIRSMNTRTEKGFNTYKAVVGNGAVYARAVELGHPRWKPGTRYPYLGPAAIELARNGTIDRTFTGALTRAIRRG